MAVAALLAVAVVTYDAADNLVLAAGDGWRALLEPRDNRFANGLGPVGAVLSRGLVGLLGYPVLGLVGLLAAWGWVLFRQRKTVWLPLISGQGLLAVILIASLFGWFGGAEAWSGAVGASVAGWLIGVLKPAGALVVLVLAAVAIALLLIDRDIQGSLDRAEGATRRVGAGLNSAWGAWRAGAAERRVLREKDLASRRERRLAEGDGAPALASRPTGDSLAIPPPAPPVPFAPAPAIEPRHFDDPVASPHAETTDDVLDDLVDEQRESASPRPGDPPVRIQRAVEEEEAELASRAAAPARTALPYTFPPLELLDAPDARQQVDASEIEENKRLLLDKLETYNIEITSIHAVVGPTVTRYELTPAPGVKISRITALEDDLAMALAAPGIRIIAPIPGKSAIGVEIPNRSRELVRLRQMLGTARFRDVSSRGAAGGKDAMALPIPIGKAIEGEVFLEDLARMPHLLIAGATGSGKSVGLNTLIVALLYACHPSDLKFVLVDPKKIELNLYATLLDHFIAMPEDVEEPITTDFAVAAGVLRSCEREMERRYDRLAEAGVRGLKEYNEKVRSRTLSAEDGHGHLPYIVVVIDELADLMMTSGKEVEAPIARLAQMARAVGIHLVIATQRPSVDVITGLIKANFPSRIAFQVASRVDSRTILDQGGAHQLVGNGDLLYMNGSRITRLQGPFLSVEEVERVTRDIARQPGLGPYMLPPLELGEGPAAFGRAGDDGDTRDDLFEDAARAIVRSQQGSVSLLQRKLSIGYTRSARIVDQLEDAGIVGPTEGSRPRQVLVASETQLDEILRSLHAADDL